ncbi:MAG: fatty acid desaturase CarF family protein [Nitrosomonadaceae bacterium]|jgi:ubiquitin-conjugating enzyme E2 variant
MEMTLVELVATILLVDFGSGLIHWMEDTFWTEDTPIIGNRIIKPNILHHTNGYAFVRNSWFHSSRDLLYAGVVLLAIGWLIGFLSWHVYLSVFLMVNANQIHKWSHSNQARIPVLVKIFQKLRILQSPQHHANHHKGEKNTHYCVITDFTNPILDKLGFWRWLESLLVPPFKAPRRVDIQANSQARELHYDV